MDNSLNSVDRLAPYTGSGKVAPSHHSEKDKERKKPDTLEESFEDELEQEQKENRQDGVTLHTDEQKDSDSSEAGPEDSTGEDRPEKDDESESPDEHVDLKA